MVDDSGVAAPQDTDRRMRAALTIIGVVAILTGVVALVVPHATLFAVAWVFGVYLLVSGLVMIGRAFTERHGVARRIGMVVLGILVFAGGIIAITHPPVGVRWIALLIGFAWLLEGVTLLYAPTTGNRGLTITSAILSVLSGILVINLPYLGAVLTVAAIATVLIVFGIAQIVSGIHAGRAAARPSET
jgi:uncharacterized membrane protein HdeD (DUF308 family)